MGNRFIGSILAVLVFAISPVIFAQTAQRPGAGKAQATTPVPDLTGVWGGHDNFYDPLPKDEQPPKKELPSMQPWALYNYTYNSMLPGGAIGTARDEVRPWILCMPYGFPAGMFATEFFEIIQSPRRVLMILNGDHEVRQIWMDGREHPKKLDPTWMGHSIGKWDGDTLVVDTIGITNHTWMDDSGIPHSDALHVVERYRRVKQDRLEVDFLYDDPKAYTKPWGRKQVYELQPANRIISEENWDGKTPPIQNYFRCGEFYDDWMKGRTFWLTK